MSASTRTFVKDREGGAVTVDIAPHGATFEDGYRAAEICDAMLKSAESGCRETVEYRS